jgi:uncharacterized protein
MFELERGKDAYDASDFSEAFDILMPLARAGSCEAQRIIAGMYLGGYGVERDLMEAISWYRPLAEQGDPVAQNNLGILLLSDEPEQAIKWLTSAAKQGFPFSQKALSDIESGELRIASEREQDSKAGC